LSRRDIQLSQMPSEISMTLCVLWIYSLVSLLTRGLECLEIQSLSAPSSWGSSICSWLKINPCERSSFPSRESTIKLKLKDRRSTGLLHFSSLLNYPLRLITKSCWLSWNSTRLCSNLWTLSCSLRLELSILLRLTHRLKMLLISLTLHSFLSIRTRNKLLRQLNKKTKNTLLMTNSRETQLFRKWLLVDLVRNCSRNVYFSCHLKYLDYQLSSFLWLSLLPSIGQATNLKFNGTILQSHTSSQIEILKLSKSLRTGNG